VSVCNVRFQEMYRTSVQNVWAHRHMCGHITLRSILARNADEAQTGSTLLVVDPECPRLQVPVTHGCLLQGLNVQIQVQP
jgi:hypothetical protein